MATHTSATSSVVTSLAMDKNFVVIGMADGPIHVFDAHSGAFLRTLEGHENGVWTLVLINTIKPTKPTSADKSKPSYARATKTRAAYRDNGQTRRSSFNNLDAFNNTSAPTSSNSSGNIPRPSTVMGIGKSDEGEGEGESEIKPRQSDPCNGANGWGNTRPLIISGGCDRQVRVWDAITG